MAAVTDLTWQQVSTAFGTVPGRANLLVEDTDAYGNTQITLNLGTLLGRQLSGLSDAGVVEALLKLRETCVIAQATANTGKAAGEKLNSFPPATFKTAANNSLPITGTIEAKAPIVVVGQSRIVGSNI